MKIIARKNSVDYSDIEFWLGFENYSAPKAYTMGSNDHTGFGDTSASFYDDDEVNTTAKLADSYGLDVTDDGSDGGDFISFDMISGNRQQLANAGRAGFYLYISNGGSTGVTGTVIYRFYLDAQNYLYVRFGDDNDLRLVWEANDVSAGLSTTGNYIAEETLYFVEFIWDSTQTNESDTLEIKINGVQRAYSNTESMTDSQFTPTEIDLGHIGATADNAYFLDVLVATTDITRDLYDLVVTKGITNYPG